MAKFQDGVIEEALMGGIYLRIYQTGGVEIFADRLDGPRSVWLDDYAWKALKATMDDAERQRKELNG